MKEPRWSVLIALTLMLLPACRADRKSPAARQGGSTRAAAGPVRFDVREKAAASRIMDVLFKHSIASRVSVEARFSPDGKVLSCQVELREPAGSPGGARHEALDREICEIVATLGHPTPPPSLNFKHYFGPFFIMPD